MLSRTSCCRAQAVPGTFGALRCSPGLNGAMLGVRLWRAGGGSCALFKHSLGGQAGRLTADGGVTQAAAAQAAAEVSAVRQRLGRQAADIDAARAQVALRLSALRDARVPRASDAFCLMLSCLVGP